MIDLVLFVFFFGAALCGLFLWNFAAGRNNSFRISVSISDRPQLHVMPRYKGQRGWALCKRLLKRLAVIVGILSVSACIVFGAYEMCTMLKDVVKQSPPLTSWVYALALAVLVFALWCCCLGVVRHWVRGGISWCHAPRPLTYRGNATLPKRVYVGDSKNVTVNFNLAFSPTSLRHYASTSADTEIARELLVHVGLPRDEDDSIEIEFLAAGVQVQGDLKQKQRLTSSSLNYQWNCYFPNSGNHNVALILRVLRSSREVQLGRIEHKIKVVRIDHLTQRQVWIFATAAAVVSGILALAEGLRRLGVW